MVLQCEEFFFTIFIVGDVYFFPGLKANGLVIASQNLAQRMVVRAERNEKESSCRQACNGL
jgi:hypothetical protein